MVRRSSMSSLKMFSSLLVESRQGQLGPEARPENFQALEGSTQMATPYPRFNPLWRSVLELIFFRPYVRIFQKIYRKWRKCNQMVTLLGYLVSLGSFEPITKNKLVWLGLYFYTKYPAWHLYHNKVYYLGKSCHWRVIYIKLFSVLFRN